MRSLFGRKKREDMTEVEEPDVSPSKDDSVHSDHLKSQSEDPDGELFEGMETEDNGLFEGMESLHSNINNNNILSNIKRPDDEEEDYEDDDDDDEDATSQPIEGMYDPAEFGELAVSPEVKEVFELITRYIPQKIELDYKLKPFIPDFIPAVGDIDAFIKVGPSRMVYTNII